MKLVKIIFLFSLMFPMFIGAVKYPVINYQTSDGLPQNQVSALIQDDMGYILIGTQSGIGKFDGTRFQVITKKDGLLNNTITCFAKDKNGNVWVGTEEGLARIGRDNRIENYLEAIPILSLTYDRDTGIIWAATRKGVHYLTGDRFVPYQKFSPPLSGGEQPAPTKTIKGVAISDSGVKYFYSQKQIIKIIKDKEEEIPCDSRINFARWLVPLQTMLIGTENGLYTFNSNETRLFPYIDLPEGMRNVTAAAVDKTGGLWVGATTGLLYYANPSSQSPTIITDQNGLQTPLIREILIDREMNIFLGTEWGVSQLSPNLIKMYGEEDGLPHRFVWAYIEDGDSILLACDRGIVQLNPHTGVITPFSVINSLLGSTSVRTITKTGDNRFLLGTREHGIYRWSRSNEPGQPGEIEQLHTTANVFSAVQTPAGMVWFGTTDGLLKYDGTQFTPVAVKYKMEREDDIDDLPNEHVHALALYDNNTLFVGTRKGVKRFHKEQFIYSELENRIEADTVINDIKVVSPTEILVATELNGLYIYKDKQIKRITTENGLLNNDVWAVIKDDSGNIWMNTSVSLERYSSNGFVSHFDKQSGIFGDEGGMHSAFKARDGRIYFSIVPGFIEIPAHQSDTGINKPNLYIKEARVNDQNLTVNGSNTIQLKFNQNNIEFQYIAVTTRKQNPVLYKTRLLPLYGQWSTATPETDIKYQNLPSDDYTFEVKANNGGGEEQWFSSKNMFTFTIDKPFWLRWWFILLLIIAGFYLVLFIIKLRLKSLERQKEHLEKLVEDRTKELEYLSITDPLTDLKNRRYLEEKIKEDISLIKRYIYETRNPDIIEATGIPMLGVFILDIDYFKKVNDDYGHKAGDIVIIDIARILLDTLRNSDTIVRWGGEEFLIITKQREQDKSFELAERIRQRIQAFDFKIDDNLTINKTVSVGFAHFPFIPNDIESVNWTHVVSLADSALYIAKNNGRNQSVGIEWGQQAIQQGIDFKDIVSNINKGVDQKYLKLIARKDHLEISQHKS
ncbi:MAG: diguanylate cyclase [bacterium]|nr:diguanylate cyclase [bacterium]